MTASTTASAPPAGKSALLSVEDALARVLDDVRVLGPEQVALAQAPGRTLAHDLAAALTNPPFDASAMDGYAVRAEDLSGNTPTLRVVGESAAGWPYAGSVRPGEAVRIFTGAALPDGADTIVIQENTLADPESVRILEAPRKGANVRWRGSDFHEGEAVLTAGTRLIPRHVLLAASAGHAMLAVVRKPVVAILSTGDELVEPSDRPMAGQIVASNAYGLAAMIVAAGGEPRSIGIARDDAEDLAHKFQEAAGADILVTTGGASVGDHDLVRPSLEAWGASLNFYKIAMRPGKPVFFGTRGSTRLLGLPGNPLSMMIAARIFLVPLLARLLGRTDKLAPVPAKLTVALPANGPRTHYMRARLDTSAHEPLVAPLGGQDSAFVRALVEANCLAIIPANAPALPAGSTIDVLALDF